MALVVRALRSKGESLPTGSNSTLASFNDRSSISDYALSAVTSLVAADVINGYKNYIRPQGTTTRAEMAVILYKVMFL